MLKKERAIIVGNILEWYDYAVYGALSPILAKIFFPTEKTATALILTMIIFSSGFVLRPISGFTFGVIADVFSKRTAFVTSLTLVSIASFFVSVLPSFHEAGYFSSLALLFCRISQGVAIGGEYPVASTYIFESSKEKTIFLTSLINSGTVMGVFIAFVVCGSVHMILNHNQMLSFGKGAPSS